MKKLKKFLAVATVVGLSVAPALGQDHRVVMAPKLTAHMGDFKSDAMDKYHERMQSAMSIPDPARRDAAVIIARQQLALDTKKVLTAGIIAELDGLLDIGGVSPQLGATG